MNLLLIKSLRGLSFCLIRMLINLPMGAGWEYLAKWRGGYKAEGSLKQLDGGFERAGLCLRLYKIVQASEMVRVPLEYISPPSNRLCLEHFPYQLIILNHHKTWV